MANNVEKFAHMELPLKNQIGVKIFALLSVTKISFPFFKRSLVVGVSMTYPLLLSVCSHDVC